VDADAVGQVQASLRRRNLRAFVGRGLLKGFEAKEMLGYKHSVFANAARQGCDWHRPKRVMATNLEKLRPTGPV
jgi:hypothetical protein